MHDAHARCADNFGAIRLLGIGGRITLDGQRGESRDPWLRVSREAKGPHAAAHSDNLTRPHNLSIDEGFQVRSNFGWQNSRSAAAGRSADFAAA